MNKYRLQEISEVEDKAELDNAFKTIIEADRAVFITAALSMASDLITYTTDGSHSPVTHELGAYIIVAEYLSQRQEAAAELRRHLATMDAELVFLDEINPDDSSIN